MTDPALITMDLVLRALEAAPLPHREFCTCRLCHEERVEAEWTALGKHLDSPEA